MEVARTRQFLFLPVAVPTWARIERLLAKVPLGAQYYVAARA